MYRVRSPTWVDNAILWTVMWYQLHDVQTNASLARPYDLLEFSRKLTNNNSKQIKMNETELKSYKKKYYCKESVNKSNKTSKFGGKKHAYQITVRSLPWGWQVWQFSS